MDRPGSNKIALSLFWWGTLATIRNSSLDYSPIYVSNQSHMWWWCL